MIVLCAQSALELPENDLAANPLLDVRRYGTPTLALSHHAGHAVSAFATSGFDDAAVLVVDGMGSPTPDLSADEKSAVIDTCVAGGETNSIYHAEGTTLKALEKHMIDQGALVRCAAAGIDHAGLRQSRRDVLGRCESDLR